MEATIANWLTDPAIGALVHTARDITLRKQDREEQTQSMVRGAVHRQETQHHQIYHLLAQIPKLGSREVAKHLAEFIRDIVGCERLCLYRIESESERILPLAVVGLSDEQEQDWWLWKERRAVYLSESFDPTVSERLRQHEIVLVDLTQPPWNKISNPYGVRELLVSPLYLKKQLVGLLQLDYQGREHTYTPEEIALIRAASQLAALIIELERLVEERAEAQADELALREANRLMDEFLGIAGHELRTPLTTIKISLQLAQRQLTRLLKHEECAADIARQIGVVQGYLERSIRQVAMQNRLVGDLLDVSRIQAGRLELHRDLCDLARLVREVVEDQRTLMPGRKLELAIAAPGKFMVMADADRVRQVVSNYLSNAFKYADAGKPVQISVEESDGEVRVAVQDEGPGLSSEHLQRIWERFYRVGGVEVKTGADAGLGLGLHISRMIIERQNGRVGVQSELDLGSTFWFTLPLAE
jgi:signal transduction histidine kinase